MPTQYYDKLPAYEGSPGWNAEPLSNALTDLRKSREFQQTSDQHQQTIDIHRQEADRRAAQDERTQQQEEMNRVAGVAQHIDSIPEEHPDRAAKWNSFISSHPTAGQALTKNGVDPGDYVQGPKYLTAQIAGYQDPQKKALLEAQAGWYNQRGEAVKQNADTRRLKAYGEIVDRLGPNPPAEVLEREGQPGGMIHAAFGGPVRPEQWPQLYQQAQARRGGGPDEHQLLDMGMDPRSVRQLQQQNAITKAVGKSPEKGHVWDFNDKGEIYQRKVSENDPRGSLPMAQLEFNLENLKNSAAVLVGKQNPKTEKYSGGSGMIGGAISQIPYAGGVLNPATKEAYLNAEHAALQLSYALSGKQIGQQEQGRILQFFVPRVTDATEIKAFKLNAAHGLFQRLIEAKKAGKTDESRAELFETELVKTARKLRDLEGGKSAEPPGPKTSPAARALSNDELLKRLNE